MSGLRVLKITESKTNVNLEESCVHPARGLNRKFGRDIQSQGNKGMRFDKRRNKIYAKNVFFIAVAVGKGEAQC